MAFSHYPMAWAGRVRQSGREKIRDIFRYGPLNLFGTWTDKKTESRKEAFERRTANGEL
jgi:hypothetical protein